MSEGGLVYLPIPVSPGRQASLTLPKDITADELSFVDQVWALYRPRLVASPYVPISVSEPCEAYMAVVAALGLPSVVTLEDVLTRLDWLQSQLEGFFAEQYKAEQAVAPAEQDEMDEWVSRIPERATPRVAPVLAPSPAIETDAREAKILRLWDRYKNVTRILRSWGPKEPVHADEVRAALVKHGIDENQSRVKYDKPTSGPRSAMSLEDKLVMLWERHGSLSKALKMWGGKGVHRRPAREVAAAILRERIPGYVEEPVRNSPTKRDAPAPEPVAPPEPDPEPPTPPAVKATVRESRIVEAPKQGNRGGRPRREDVDPSERVLALWKRYGNLRDVTQGYGNNPKRLVQAEVIQILRAHGIQVDVPKRLQRQAKAEAIAASLEPLPPIEERASARKSRIVDLYRKHGRPEVVQQRWGGGNPNRPKMDEIREVLREAGFDLPEPKHNFVNPPVKQPAQKSAPVPVAELIAPLVKALVIDQEWLIEPTDFVQVVRGIVDGEAGWPAGGNPFKRREMVRAALPFAQKLRGLSFIDSKEFLAQLLTQLREQPFAWRVNKTGTKPVERRREAA